MSTNFDGEMSREEIQELNEAALAREFIMALLKEAGKAAVKMWVDTMLKGGGYAARVTRQGKVYLVVYNGNPWAVQSGTYRIYTE